MKASIVIRTFNSERTIEQVLDGVRSQAFRDYEIIIVDAGSTDLTLEIVKKYPHTLVDYSNQRFTYSGSLNAGCSQAQGEYIVVLSHHCIPLHERWLSSLVETMEVNEQLAGAWGRALIDVEDYPIGNKAVEVINIDAFYKRPNHGLQNSNSIIRRELWEQHPFSMDIDRCEDQEWAHHFLRRGYRTASLHEAVVLYQISYGLVAYAIRAMQLTLTLNELFGYSPEISASDIFRESRRALRLVALGKRSPRKTGLFVSNMLGRWVASKIIPYREGSRHQRQLARSGKSTEGESQVRGIRNGLSVFARKTAGGESQVAQVSTGNKKATETQLAFRFFLVGEMRSGTSWLSSTLNTHPQILCQGEGGFFGRTQSTEEIPVYTGPTPSLYNALAECRGFREWHSLSWNAWAREDLEEDARNLTRLAVDYYLSREATRSEKWIVGDKSPLHTDHVDEIFEFYPEAKVIQIIRDGRDVAVSLMHHFWRLAKDRGGVFDLEGEELDKRDAYYADPEGFLKSGESIFTEERLRQMAVRWNRRVNKASQDGMTLFNSNYRQLRYEDLLAMPEENLKKLFEFLDAKADDDTISRCIRGNSFESLANRSRGQEDANSFFRKGVVGDWRSVFTERDREIYWQIAGVTLERMRYSVD